MASGLCLGWGEPPAPQTALEDFFKKRKPCQYLFSAPRRVPCRGSELNPHAPHTLI